MLGGEHDNPTERGRRKRRPPTRKRKKQAGGIDVDATCSDAFGPPDATNGRREVLQVTANPRPRARLVKKSQQIPTITAAPDMQPTTSLPFDLQLGAASPQVPALTALAPAVNETVEHSASDATSSCAEHAEVQLTNLTRNKRERTTIANKRTSSKKQKITLREHGQTARQDDKHSTSTSALRGSCLD